MGGGNQRVGGGREVGRSLVGGGSAFPFIVMLLIGNFLNQRESL